MFDSDLIAWWDGQLILLFVLFFIFAGCHFFADLKKRVLKNSKKMADKKEGLKIEATMNESNTLRKKSSPFFS